MTPLLGLRFGIHPATAVDTDLPDAAVTKSVGTAVHGRNKSVNWQIVRRLAAGSVPAPLVTFLIMHATDTESAKGGPLIFLPGVVLLMTSATLLYRQQTVAFLGSKIEATNDSLVRNLTNVTGVVLGALVMTTSVGAGAIGVTALLTLYPRMPTLTIIGSDIAYAVPLTLIAGLGHWWMGEVNWLLLATLLIGSIPGILIGSLLALELPEGRLRSLLAVILALDSVQLMGFF